jgi:hypothetical protein
LAAAALQAAAQAQSVDDEPAVVVEEVPVIIEDEKEEDAAAPIEEAIFVDEETGDAVPVMLVDEELVEQILEVSFLGLTQNFSKLLVFT